MYAQWKYTLEKGAGCTDRAAATADACIDLRLVWDLLPICVDDNNWNSACETNEEKALATC